MQRQQNAAALSHNVLGISRGAGTSAWVTSWRGLKRARITRTTVRLQNRRLIARLKASGGDSGTASASVYQDWHQDYSDTSMVFAGVQGIHHPEPEYHVPHAPTAHIQTEARPTPSIWTSMGEILQMSLPLTLTNVSGFTLNCFSDAMIGRLGASALGTTTLANSFYGMMGISIIWGGAAGMETLAGQAFGAGQTRMMRLVLLRAMVVCWALCLPIAFLWQHAEWMMIKLGQSATMAAQGAVYLQALVPSLFVYVLAECLQSYLVCQNNVQPATWAKGITAALGPVFYYVLMFKMRLGLQGAAYAYALCKLTNALLLIGWMMWQGDAAAPSPPQSGSSRDTSSSSSSSSSSISGREAAAGGMTSSGAEQDASTVLPAARASTASEHIMGANANDGNGVTSSSSRSAASGQAGNAAQDSGITAGATAAGVAAAGMAGGAIAAGGITVLPDISLAEVLDLKGAWEYIKFGVPSAMMTMLEWWAYEINVLLTGTLPNAEVAVAVLGICLAISGWVYMFPQSISTSTCARISNALGGGDAAAAQSYFWAAMLMVACSQTTLASCILLAARHLVNFFCQDPGVMAIALGIVPIVACNTFADGMNVVLNGVLRACGRQSLGARLQLCSYWLVGVPLSWFLGVKAHLGIAGFLIAIGLTSITQAIVCGSIISRFNWQHEVKRSQQILSDMSATMSMDGPNKEA